MTHAPITIEGKVESVLITGTEGNVTSDTYGTGSLATIPVRKIQLVRGYGVRGDRHAGTRLADVREKELLSFGFEKGTEISNFREFSAVSAEELEEVRGFLDLSKEIPYGSLGENLVISGIPKFSELPSGTLILFRKNEKQIRTAVLAVWKENGPCRGPGEVLQNIFPEGENLESRFPKASIGRRGIVGSVYVSGFVHEGDIAVIKIPQQRIYSLE